MKQESHFHIQTYVAVFCYLIFCFIYGIIFISLIWGDVSNYYILLKKCFIPKTLSWIFQFLLNICMHFIYFILFCFFRYLQVSGSSKNKYLGQRYSIGIKLFALYLANPTRHGFLRIKLGVTSNFCLIWAPIHTTTPKKTKKYFSFQVFWYYLYSCK